jgi:tetratricopeptide repeat protein 21B
MMADISFRKTDFETASVHFQQLLAKQPRYWTALARFIEVMRRAGTLSQVPPFLEKAGAKGEEPGLAYCQVSKKDNISDLLCDNFDIFF